MSEQADQDTFGGMSSLTPENYQPAWTPQVPQWVAVVSIVVGVLGMLCWGVQGTMVLGMVAEYLALRTAAQAAPDAVPEFLDMRLAALAGLPEDGVLDLLAWSVGEGEIVRVMTLADGESLKLRWSTQRPSEIERAVEQATHALDRLGPEQATQLAKDIRFWKELAEIN